MKSKVTTEALIPYSGYRDNKQKLEPKYKESKTVDNETQTHDENNCDYDNARKVSS